MDQATKIDEQDSWLKRALRRRDEELENGDKDNKGAWFNSAMS